MLVSANFFYQILIREISHSQRGNTKLSIVRIQLIDSTFKNNDEYELEIIKLSKIIKSNSRASDISARMGRYEFFTLITNGHEQATAFSRRVDSNWKSTESDINITNTEFDGKESMTQFLRRAHSSNEAGIITDS